jgi:hypothetical protein
MEGWRDGEMERWREMERDGERWKERESVCFGLNTSAVHLETSIDAAKVAEERLHSDRDQVGELVLSRMQTYAKENHTIHANALELVSVRVFL